MKDNWIKILMERRGASIVIGMFLLFFITDATNAVVRYFESVFGFLFFTDKLKMSAYSRGLAWISIFSLVLFINWSKKSLWVVVGFAVLLFIIGVNWDDKEHLLSWMKRFSKLTFPFLLWWFFKNTGISSQKLHLIRNVFLFIIGLQLIVVFIPFLFDLDIFLSYDPGRFGYSGFIIARNEATCFYLLAAVFVLHLWEQKRDFKYIIWLIFVLAGTLLLGTKAGLLVIAGIKGYLLVKNFERHRVLVITIFVLAIAFSLAGLYWSGMINFYSGLMKEYGFWAMLTSFRSDLFAERVPAVLNEWHWYNYLFGGVNPATSFVEMDIIDLFLFGGIVGSIVYYLALFKTVFAFKSDNYLGWFLVGMFFLIGGIAGHFFASGVNALYLVTVCWFLQKKNQMIFIE